MSQPTQEQVRPTTLVVEGGRRLAGNLSVEGNKNAALPLLAACLLTDKPCRLTNVPRITDVGVMVQLLQGLGAEVEGAGGSTLDVCCEHVTTDEPDPRLVGRLRGSVLLYGPLLARRGRACLAAPGGDFPARRTIAAHLAGPRRDGGTRGARGWAHVGSARWSSIRIDLLGRGVRDRHRDRDSGSRRGVGHNRDPSCRVRASRRRAVRVPPRHGCRH